MLVNLGSCGCGCFVAGASGSDSSSATSNTANTPALFYWHIAEAEARPPGISRSQPATHNNLPKRHSDHTAYHHGKSSLITVPAAIRRQRAVASHIGRTFLRHLARYLTWQ